MNEKEEQQGRQNDNEGGGNDGRSPSFKEIREGRFEDVEPHKEMSQR